MTVCECADCTERSVLERMAAMTRAEAFAEAWSRTRAWQNERVEDGKLAARTYAILERWRTP